eukprot:gb/GFBE01045889.1/.p1 GENE.gb/GFBE01045889.1/~~gb/GFBE01045889.1/.p1  ORF type:complete len:339 (+),score=82.39 gb/GFBE01045889.1/:1-1017(+)
MPAKCAEMGLEAQPSDSLRMRLWSQPVEEAISYFKTFGELSRTEVAGEDDQQFLEVSYFDVRSAYAAKAFLGDTCTYLPMHGQRSLRLIGTAQLSAPILEQVSSVQPTEEGDYTVHFFDTRVMKLAAASALGEKGEPAAVHMADGQRLGRNAAAKLASSEVSWKDLASKKEHRTTLQLRGVPKALCGREAMDGFLEARGLQGKVAKVLVPSQTKTSRLPHGSLILQAASPEDVPGLVKFFHGRQLLGARPIAVSFAEQQRKRQEDKVTLSSYPMHLDSATMSSLPPFLPGSLELSESQAEDGALRSGDSDTSEKSTSWNVEAEPWRPSPPPGLEVYIP